MVGLVELFNGDMLRKDNLMQRFCYVDIESGGLDPKVHGITEIAAIAFDFDSKHPLSPKTGEEEFNVIIRPNPNLAYTPYALELQDRTLQYLEEYGTSEENAFYGFENFLQKHLGKSHNWSGRIIAQYSEFDHGFLVALAQRCGRGSVLPVNRRCEWLCTKSLYRILSSLGILRLDNSGLNDLMHWYHISFEGKEHNALTCVKAGIGVFRSMVNDLKKYYGGIE